MSPATTASWPPAGESCASPARCSATDPTRSSVSFDAQFGWPVEVPATKRGAMTPAFVAESSRRASSLVEEGLAGAVALSQQVELEGEALFEAVAALHVDGVDAVEELLGPLDHRRTLGRDLGGDLACRGAELVAFDDAEHRSVVVELGRGGGRARVDHRPHLVLWHEPGQVGGGAEGTTVDLGQPEGGVARGDDDVGVADDADPTAEAETTDRGDHRHLALVHRG